MIPHLLKRYPLTAACLLAIWVLCLITPPSSDNLPSFSGFDKACHVVMYLGSCSVLWWERLRAGAHTRRSFVTAMIVVPILMSGLIEIVQQTATTSRGAEWTDVAANALGTLLGTAFGRFVLQRHMRRP